MSRIENRRAIIDRRTLIADIEGEVADLAPDALRSALFERLKKALGGGEAEIRARFEADHNGLACVRARSFLIDQIVRTLYDVVVRYVYPVVNPTRSERLCLVAVGGYGRAEMAPCSDVDLLFLLPYKQTPWGEQVVEYLLYFLWDLGLKVGHAVRSVDECLNAAKADFTIRTGLLESRFIFGDQDLFAELKARFDEEVVAGTSAEFVEAKLTERDERHKRLGDSRYVVEPNVKDGKGGLRDLQTLYWIGKYLYRVDRIAQLVDKEFLSRDEYREFAKAARFLLTTRCMLHYLAGRAEERLTFDIQIELAKQLGYEDRPGLSGTERFMKKYYLTAKTVGDLTRIFCAQLEEQETKSSLLKLPRIGLRKREIDGFPVDGGRITVSGDDHFAEKPIDIMRLFHIAQERELDIHPEALRLITRNLFRVKALRSVEEANRLFLEILTSRKDPELALRRMNEAGVLGRFIPDFGRVVAQMQYNMYHSYTVDEHTIRAIGILSRIEAGELADDHPVADEIVHEVISREVLYVALFLHDIAKGREGDHSELGAEVAEELCPRLGMSAAETETVAWLVLNHLIMSDIAFKRDIADPKTVKDFAEKVQSPERLRLLLVLTVADIRAVGPNVWNGWKGQLLRDLYYATQDVLSGGIAGKGRAARIEQAQDGLRQALADWPEKAIESYIGRHFENYWLSADDGVLKRDAELVRKADDNNRDLAVRTHTDQFQAITEVTVYTADHPGLFARLTGAIAVSGGSIRDAKIFTTKDGMALDHFWIQDANGEAFDESRRLKRLRRTIEETLAGEMRPREELARKTGLPRRTDVFTVKPRVLIDNKASDTHTVIEVNGRDRDGLLSDLARALFDANVSIASAHITTYGERAVDVFYVRDLFGHKISHPNKLKTIEKGLLAALGARDEDIDAADAAKSPQNGANGTKDDADNKDGDIAAAQ